MDDILHEEVREFFNTLKVSQMPSSNKVDLCQAPDMSGENDEGKRWVLCRFPRSQKKLTFIEAVKNNSCLKEDNEKSNSIPLKQIPNPKVVSGNAVVEVDADEYQRGVQQPKLSVIGKLSLHRGDPIPTTMEVKSKLAEGLKIEEIQVIAIGNISRSVV